MPKLRKTAWIASAACLAVAFAAQAQTPKAQTPKAQTPRAKTPGDALAAGFASPPNAARPRVWWHWLNGNITKDGIAKDIAWMSRVGIGGLQNFDADLRTPQVVDKRLVYMSPEWKDAFRYAATLADRNGLELAIAASPGWSETGGPWVAPRDGMKKLVWSETTIDGGRPLTGRLADPPHTTGRFADLPREAGSALGAGPPETADFYGDAAVLAYRLPDAAAAPLPAPRMTLADGAPVDAAALTDRSWLTGFVAPRGTRAAPAEIRIDYPAPVTLRSLAMAMADNTNTFGQGGTGLTPRLEAQDAQGRWTPVAEVDLRWAPQTTVGFPAVTASRFRVVLAPSREPPRPGRFDDPNAPPPTTVGIRELRLSAEARVNRGELKAGFGVAPAYYALDGALADEPGIAPASVVDLTARMKPDGALDWTPPPGRWRILRLGYSLLGTTNHPTTKEASGLEVDKFDGPAVRRYVETYLGMYRDAAGPDLMGKRGLKAMLTDSIEVGAANWTPAILDQFQRLRGYDPRPWLPVLTGTVIGSRRESDGFLYDWRRTLADLLASEHYGTVAKVAREHGLTLYGEAIEDRRPMLGEDLVMRSHADIPMAAFWTYAPEVGPNPTYLGDMRGAASVAHIYGQNLVAAESLTSAGQPWAFAPHDLKKFIDLEFASGVNRPVIHTSVHQPLDDRQPGFSLFIFGQYFNRHETWAEMARPWVDYMARSSFLLQQGRSDADVAYFIGEERPVTQLYVDRAIGELPRGYGFDFVSPDLLSGPISVQDGELRAVGGARYRLLYLGGDSARMTLPTLKRIAKLAADGAVIAGRAPIGSPSQADDPQAFARLVKQLWAGGPETRVVRGRVIVADSAAAALQRLGVRPDFDAGPDREVLFQHRRLANGHLYFLNNRKARPEHFEARFRVKGLAPEIWRAETGKAEPVSYRIEGEETVVPLDMIAEDALFVVFRKPAAQAAHEVKRPETRTIATLAAPWTVAFPPGRGAPASIRLDRLAPLNEAADPGVKYFSGVAAYRTSLAAKAARPGETVWLDLGAVGDIAEVRVNGKPVGTAWHAPFRVDVSSALRDGDNAIEVRVADLWVNRLIGDKQPDARPITFTTAPTYDAKAPLRPAGLIGPVTLVSSQ